MRTLKQQLKGCLKKDLLALINKYSSNAEEEREVFNLMKEILNEGF